MIIKEFNTEIINQGFTQTDKHIVFQTPDGKVYTNVEIIPIRQGNEVICKVKLNDKIEPTFKVGDVVTNASGLYPNVKCTISKVNYNEQYYCYKEVAGVTYFKDQDKLILVDNIEPKFKAGDKVKGASSENPEKVFVINIVNTGHKCYHYFNSNGIVTMFKDQDKLILVKGDEVQPPVEGENSIEYTSFASYSIDNVINYNVEHYDLIKNISKNIIRISKEGGIYYRFIVPMKAEVDESGVSYEEDKVCGIIRWHFNKLGYKIEEKVNVNYNEFFISW